MQRAWRKWPQARFELCSRLRLWSSGFRVQGLLVLGFWSFGLTVLEFGVWGLRLAMLKWAQGSRLKASDCPL